MKALWFFINFAVKQCPIAHKYRYMNFLFELYRAVDHLISAVRIVYSYLFVYALNNWRVTFFLAQRCTCCYDYDVDNVSTWLFVY